MQDDITSKKVIPIIEEEPKMVSLYQAHVKIQPKSVKGFFNNWRWVMVWVTQIVFYCLPWIEWGQRQAVLFDLGARRFYIFGLVLYPQDFIYLTGILVISALSLFLFTAVAGRLWCGYACPQTVYSEIFMWIEKKIEGDRSARLRLDGESITSTNKLWRKTLKHFLWIVLAFWTGFTFVGYFTPIKDLAVEFAQWNLGAWEIFWVFFYAFATYGNAGFMREQVCLHMCPYARFQSAMFDKDTLIVTYDQDRGEPRGARSKKADPKALNLGSCVDCSLCVQVCPTGIDIRNGLQYQCIGCGACADVCDGVMDKLGYERGLVRYTTENAMLNKWTKAQTWRHVLRPRVLVYTSILLGIVIAMLVSLATRTQFKVNVVRDRGVMARIVEGGKLENLYQLQVMNATEKTQRYKITVTGLPNLAISSDSIVTLESTQQRKLAVRVQAPYDVAAPGTHEIHFEIDALDSEGHLSEKTVFIVPK